MRLTGCVSVLGCRNLEACLDFYKSALQFVIIRQRRSSLGIEWAYLASGNCFLMLEALPESETHVPITSRLYLYTDDVLRLHQYLVASGHEPGDIRTTNYGMQEFDILDPDNHHLSIGEKK